MQVAAPVRLAALQQRPIDLWALLLWQMPALPGLRKLQAGTHLPGLVGAQGLVGHAQVDFSEHLIAAQGDQLLLARDTLRIGARPETRQCAMQTLARSMIATQGLLRGWKVVEQLGDPLIDGFYAFKGGHGPAPAEKELAMLGARCRAQSVHCYDTEVRGRQSPRRPNTAGMPRPTQARASHQPSPSSAANSPAAPDRPMTSGQAKTLRVDCDRWLMLPPPAPADAVACPTTGTARCPAR
ncbi:hypothetical protein D3C76_828380 [compost metagenome]